MKKIISFLVLALGTLSLALPAFAQQQPRVSPFTDNLYVNLHNFPANTALKVSYVDNNGVNISGPTPKTVSGSPQWHVQIASQNLVENGDPTMIIELLASGTSCQLQFVDGPWTTLAFLNGGAPVCTHLNVGNIVPAPVQPYVYTMDITYK